MANELSGPAGWRGQHSLDLYRLAVDRVDQIEQWAEDTALRDPTARAVWMAIARADLEGRVLTKSDLAKRCGVTRYLMDRLLRRATAQGLIVTNRNKMDGRHTIVCMTDEGRRYLMSALDSFIKFNVSGL